MTPILGILVCAVPDGQPGRHTWVVFGIWMLVGVAIYLGYGRRRSRVAPEPRGSRGLSGAQPPTRRQPTPSTPEPMKAEIS